MLVLLSRLACPRVVTSLRKTVVCFDLGGGGGGCSKRLCIGNPIVLVNVLLDESVRTVLKLCVEDDVSLLVEVCMLVLWESEGASAEEG